MALQGLKSCLHQVKYVILSEECAKCANGCRFWMILVGVLRYKYQVGQNKEKYVFLKKSTYQLIWGILGPIQFLGLTLHRKLHHPRFPLALCRCTRFMNTRPGSRHLFDKFRWNRFENPQHHLKLSLQNIESMDVVDM